jgi:hypothetical protein
MKYYYSNLMKGFFCKEIHGKNIPEDSIEITQEKYRELLKKSDEGKNISVNEKKEIILEDPIPKKITWEEVRMKRNEFLKESDWIVLEDANPKPSKKDWVDYREKLRKIPQNFKDPEKIIWPEKPK